MILAGEGAGKAMSRIYSNIGFKGLWNGLPVRIGMIGYVHYGDDPSNLVLHLSRKTCFKSTLTFPTHESYLATHLSTLKSNADTELCVERLLPSNG